MPRFVPHLQVPKIMPPAITGRLAPPPAPTPANSADGLTLDALMARQKALAEQQGQVQQMDAGTPMQGIGKLAWSFVDALKQRQAEKDIAAGNADIAGAMKQMDMNTGELPPEAISTIMQRNPELGQQMIEQFVASRRQKQQDALAEQRRQQDREWQLLDEKTKRGEQLSDAETARKTQIEAEQRAAGREIAKEGRTEASTIREENRAADTAAAQPKTPQAKIMEDYAAGRYGAQGSPEAMQLRDDAMAAANAKGGGTAADKKVLYDQQDQFINTSSAIGQLTRAKQLLDAGISTGYTSGMRTYAGNTGLLGQGEADLAANTKEYNSIMNQEAITAMSQALKGSTTDTEMREFIANMNDPTIPPQVKARQIDTMLAKAGAFAETQRQRIIDMGGDPPELPKRLTPEAEATLLQSARDAIAKGADPALVKKRLADKGADPGKL